MLLLFLCGLCACLAVVQTQSNFSVNASFHRDAVLHPSMHEIVMVGHRSIIKIMCDKLPQNIRLSAFLDRPLAHIHPEHILCLLNSTESSKGFSEPSAVSKSEITSQSSSSSKDEKSTTQHLEITGLLPGQTFLFLQVSDPDDENGSLQGELLPDTYVVTVVERVDMARDAFMYVLSMVKFFTLLLLGFRMRNVAVKEVLTRPCALINAILCQVALLPLVTLGSSLALSLPIHSVVCLLVIGCCPTGVLSPLFSVLQQSHVELAIILTFIETVAAFGAVPGWLFAYGHFLGVAYSQVSFPYLHIAGALGYVAGPILLGMALKRCVRSPLQQLDKAIQPVCLLVVLIAVTVSVSDLLHLWVHVTWKLLVACALLPVGGFLIGAIVNAIFRQKLPQLKTVAVVTSVQNTLLARVILQTSYPAEDSSLMAVTISCVEAMTLGLMLLAYIVHILVWLSCQRYRVSHDSVGISGLQCSIGERLVKNMVKAGEIRFCNRERSRPITNSAPPSKTPSACCSVDTMASKVSKISERNILNNRASSFTQKTLGSVNRAFSSSFDSLGRNSQIINAGPTVETTSTLNYFASPDESQPQMTENKEIYKDTLSIDYDMLTLSKNGNNNDKNKNESVPPESTPRENPCTGISAPDNIGLIEYTYKQ